jgi:hypothetical protein
LPGGSVSGGSLAHAAGHDPHKHFLGERRRKIERLDLERS